MTQSVSFPNNNNNNTIIDKGCSLDLPWPLNMHEVCRCDDKLDAEIMIFTITSRPGPGPVSSREEEDEDLFVRSRQLFLT